MSWQICFFLHRETKQISAFSIVRISCLSSQIHPLRQYELSNQSLLMLWNKKRIILILLCELISYNLSNSSSTIRK